MPEPGMHNAILLSHLVAFGGGLLAGAAVTTLVALRRRRELEDQLRVQVLAKGQLLDELHRPRFGRGQDSAA